MTTRRTPADLAQRRNIADASLPGLPAFKALLRRFATRRGTSQAFGWHVIGSSSGRTNSTASRSRAVIAELRRCAWLGGFAGVRIDALEAETLDRTQLKARAEGR